MAFLDANGARHYFRLEGDPARDLLVLAHPIGADHGFWSSQVELFAGSARILRYDLRGHGATEATRATTACRCWRTTCWR